MIGSGHASKATAASAAFAPVPTDDNRSDSLDDSKLHVGMVLYRDALGRQQGHLYRDDADFWLNPKDGRLDKLPRIQNAKTIKNATPYAIQIVCFLTTKWKISWLAWIPGCLALLILLCLPTDLEGHTRNNGGYDPVIYRDWAYARIARNQQEDRPSDQDLEDDEEDQQPLFAEHGTRLVPVLGKSKEGKVSTTLTIVTPHGSSVDYHSMSRRLLRPRYLCYLTDSSEDGLPYQTKATSTLDESVSAEYVFISYTREHFHIGRRPESTVWDTTGPVQPNGWQALIEVAVKAAKSANVPAFWLDLECLRPDNAPGGDNRMLPDVYRISDIVRASHSVVIALPGLLNDEALVTWGDRIWTLPEALLAPTEHGITVASTDPKVPPMSIAKRNIAARAWPNDADDIRQLFDHLEGTIVLTPLELMSIGLKCLQRRKRKHFFDGDVSYALMGLMRRRPPICPDDSDFEAFARLSLANDSDLLLERLICMHPTMPRSPWHEMEDAWKVQLWDIAPTCQVAGIVDNRTILLDGAFGATIYWHKLKQVAFFKRPNLVRKNLVVFVRGFPAFIIPIITLIIYSYYVWGSPAFEATTITTLALAGPFLLMLPVIMRHLYRGKFWSTQAWFFGIQGIPDLGQVERYLFGLDCGRLKWSTNGSMLSRHRYVDGECRAIAPKNLPANKDGMKLYTIVDTLTMTATPFYAERPPTVALVCGREGGMQRALPCSYDMRSQTFVKETVLRMKTIVLDRMSRVDRLRFCVTREGWKTTP